jgi:hypothetical protein
MIDKAAKEELFTKLNNVLNAEIKKAKKAVAKANKGKSADEIEALQYDAQEKVVNTFSEEMDKALELIKKEYPDAFID